MLTIEGIQKLVGRNMGAANKIWKITKVNDEVSDAYYGIVCRQHPDSAGDYVVLYLERDKKDFEYHISSNKSNIKRAVTLFDMKNQYDFLRLIQREIERALC